MSWNQSTKERVISLFLDGLDSAEMFRQLTREKVKISHKDMNAVVYNYMDSLPESIDNVDCTKMNSKQVDNLKSVINGKLVIDMKIHKFETMKEEVNKLKVSMEKLYPEKLYAPELELVTNSVRYAIDAGVPLSLIRKRFKNLNRIPRNNMARWSSVRKVSYKERPGVY